MHLKKILNDYFKSVLAFIKQIFLSCFGNFHSLFSSILMDMELLSGYSRLSIFSFHGKSSGSSYLIRMCFLACMNIPVFK